MNVLTLAQIRKATSPNPWTLTNKVLYDLCRAHPGHQDKDAVLAKILLIGRSYAAAIERRKGKDGANDDFYLSRVAPSIMKSGIDGWIAQARAISPKSPDSLEAMVAVHAKTTELFRSISGLNKRSLASKYLHFHVPRLFFIYDTRAVLGMRALGGVVGRAVRSTGSGDNEYRKFAEKCLRLQRACKDRSGAELDPREIDNLLLAIAHEGPRG